MEETASDVEDSCEYAKQSWIAKNISFSMEV
jgi:hypothetical protein